MADTLENQDAQASAENSNGSPKEHSNGATNETTSAPVEPSDFAVVQDDDGGEPMELPIAPEDNTLGVATLTHAFPGASGLKYKNPKTGASRALMIDQLGAKFLPPTDGWNDKVFTVIFPSAPRGESAWKRRKVDGESDGEDDSAGIKQKRLNDPNTPIDLIVLGVSYKTTPEGFRKYFEQYGTVVVADLKRDVEGKSKGFGFVQMSSLEEQQRVLDVSPHMMDGRRCEVKIPDQRVKQQSEMFHNPHLSREMTTNKIFVGRLPEGTSTDDLRNFFEREATKHDSNVTITDVFIPRPFRGFGFVSFSSSEVARKIVKLGNLVLQGNSLAASLAVPRESQETGSAYGYAAPRAAQLYGFPNVAGGFGGYAGAYGGAGAAAAAGYASDWMDSSQARFFSWQGPSGSNATSNQATTAATSAQARNHPVAGVLKAAGRAALASPAPPSHPASLATNLDALNLNRSNPDVFNAAWQVFLNTLKTGGGTPSATAAAAAAQAAMGQAAGHHLSYSSHPSLPSSHASMSSSHHPQIGPHKPW